MRALCLHEGSLTVRTDIARPEPGEGETLIRVTLAGICGTDLEMVQGYKGGFSGILGHELVGVIESSPEPRDVGQRVTASINIGCGKCSECSAHGPEHCEQRTVLGILGRDGAFADYVTVPAANLHRIPDQVPDEHAVFTEPLAAALRVREHLAADSGQRVAVVGPGRLGMLAGRVLALDGAEVTMIARRDTSLELARKWGLRAAIAGNLPNRSFDLVVDTSGSAAGFGESVRLVRPRGTLVLKSTHAGDSHIDLNPIVVSEINVIGSRCGPFAPALQLLGEGAIEVGSLIDGEYSLARGLAAFEGAATSRKILLRP